LEILKIDVFHGGVLTVMESKRTQRPFGIKDKIGYLFGDLGNDFTFILSSGFLLKFYTDIIGVDAFIIGIVMMGARFLDAFTDVTMGRICDSRKSGAEGKFRPWIKWMSIPCALSSFLVYQSGVASWPYGARVAWLIVTYLLWGSIFYTSVNIPYGSMASAITADAGERQSLSTYRTMGSTIAGAIIGAGIPLLAYDKSEDSSVVMNGGRFTLIAGVLSILAIVSYLICYRLVSERVNIEATPRGKYGIKDVIRSALKNRALISIIAASIIMLLSQMTVQQMANYIFPDYYGSAEAQSVSTVVMLLGMILSAALARPLAVKYGKAEVSAISSILSGAVNLLLFFVRPKSVWIYVGFSFASWLGLGIFAMVSWALITDVIDYSEKKNGVREDATIYSLYSFSRKLGQGAAAGISGALLTLIGYDGAAGGSLSQSVREGIFNISTLVPAIGFILLGLILLFWYPLKKREVDAMQK
jgi:GPH family glycoside/pentoside/hexuronide:cation symporter